MTHIAMAPLIKRRSLVSRGLQRGLTLVELMVALVLGLLVAGAAIAALIIARQGFTSTDSASQLRENARFATNLIQRVVVQAGFENAAYGLFADPKLPGLNGYDNALLIDNAPNQPGGQSNDSRSTCTVTDTSCVNRSDVLVVRYWGVSRAGTADGTMIDCGGRSEPEGVDRAWSVFHVMRSSSGEPTLMCSFVDPSTGNWMTVPLVQGVESFQVLYGVDHVTAGTAPPLTFTDTDSVPYQYLRAADLVVPGDLVGTQNNWSRVRSVRVGMILRGSAGSATGLASGAQTWNVLGPTLTNAADQLSTPADNRLRQNVVFTVHLRNAQHNPS